MTQTKADQLTHISLSVFKLNGQLIEWGNHFSQPHGLTSARWQVLGAIALAPQPPNVPQIAATMGGTRQGVLKQINLLLDEGLVQPLANPTHKKSPLYALTQKGQTTYSTLAERWGKQAQKMADEFSADDLNTTLKVLVALTQLYENEASTGQLERA